MAAQEFPVHAKPKGTLETVVYQFDFTPFPEFADGETLASVSVPAVSGLTHAITATVTSAITDGVAAGKGAEVAISGGTTSTEYTVKAHGTFSPSGSVRDVWLRLEVK